MANKGSFHRIMSVRSREQGIKDIRRKKDIKVRLSIKVILRHSNSILGPCINLLPMPLLRINRPHNKLHHKKNTRKVNWGGLGKIMERRLSTLRLGRNSFTALMIGVVE
jgi:hypothetical protein